MRRVELRVMERLVTHLLSQSITFFEQQERGDLIQAVRQDVAQLRIVLVAILSLFLDGMLVLGLLVSAFILSPMTMIVVGGS